MTSLPGPIAIWRGHLSRLDRCLLSAAWRLPTVVVLVCGLVLARSVEGESDKAQSFFDGTNLTVFHVTLTEEAVRQLEERPKSYAPGKVSVAGKVLDNVGIRLKGTGTFESIDARPSMALKFNWKEPHQQFCGLNKLFLENSDQDASRMCKLVANGAFADGGIPAPRITQARVELNGRDLGLYVVSEAINKDFLRHHFGNAEGNLYEAEFRDINSRLKQDNGVPGDQSDLRELYAAARQGERDKRRDALDQILKTEEFLDFLAIEMILANWDGYAIGQNNYRIYHDPVSRRLSFIPHDLDNTLAESGMCLMPPQRSILTSALLETHEDRASFRQRVAKLFPKVLDPDAVQRRVQASVNRLTQGATPERTKAIQRQAALLEQRVEERKAHLRAELAENRPATPEFDSVGVARLSGWIPKPDWNNALVESEVVDGKTNLTIHAAGGYCFGSWRLPVWLPAGSYRFEASAKTSGVSGLPSRTGSGAGVRVLGTRRGFGIQGSNNWVPVRHLFSVQEDCEWVELIAELRAFHGTAWFDPDSLRLVRIK